MKLLVPLFTLALVESIHAASICNALTPNSWTQAASSNPKLQGALNELSKNAVATWYTDRGGDAISDLLQKCSGSQVPSIVIYGLPNKDCADGFSSSGNNKDAAMYKTWVQSLVSRVGSREVVYVLEPDAIGLLSNNYCAKENNYLDNLKVALGLISSGNPNAKVYVDVASWANVAEATKVLNNLKTAGRLDGVTINTSNYKTNAQLMSFCSTISGATGGLHCVFDTSRNYRGSVGDEWCNSRSAGIGAPPGTDTGHPLVDYNLWLKVPGESDGTCSGRTPDAQEGPSAGLFFPDGFASLWDNSWFVDVKGLPKINGGGSWTGPSPSSATPKPVTTETSKPVVTLAPTTSTPPQTEPPETNAPVTTTTPPSTPSPTTSNEPPTTSTAVPILSSIGTTENPTTTPAATYAATTEAAQSVVPVSTSTAEPESTAQENESGNESAVLGPTSSTPAPTNPAVQSRVATSTDKPNEVISVQSSVETTNITTGMIVLIAGVAAAAVVATVLAVMVIRKRNAQEKHNDRLDSQGGVVALGVTHGLETERCMQML
ncbi:hypothetical protein DYB25_009548 [Aphanomyces astaci]|uniref:Glucanase n=3 Tax=Aphanomyces astaci TaxID=112090 RepID=A0A397AGU1_APHAT|nr:hypothetical protein DYB25_009548 [Aphanomyces astaci]RHY44757.1 hypothetical protein DYB38_009534 [Aphanomyces astaci]RHY62244.1 hypothetical protein DYB34_009850 [Aphanomyces astaci]